MALRESEVELLGLPVGDYVVRVRCRSQNSPLWSKWSSELMLSIPAQAPAGELTHKEGGSFFTHKKYVISLPASPAQANCLCASCCLVSVSPHCWSSRLESFHRARSEHLASVKILGLQPSECALPVRFINKAAQRNVPIHLQI